MNRVGNLSQLGDPVNVFTGATVDEAIKSAEDWAARNNRQLAGNYFLQIRIGKSETIICDLKDIGKPYTVGQELIARLRDDPKGLYDCQAKIIEINDEKMIVEVFSDIYRKHEYNFDGVRIDGEAYLVE